MKGRTVSLLEKIVPPAIARISAAVPRPLFSFCASCIGATAERVLSKRREIAVRNIETAFPSLSSSEAEALLHAHFIHLAKTFLELTMLPAMRNSRGGTSRIVYHGVEKLEECLESGRSPIIMTAHQGNWEMLTTLALFVDEFVSLHKPQGGAAGRYINICRSACGMQLVSKREGLRKMMAALRRGSMVGLLADQGGLDEFIFFGRPARFPLGAETFAVRYAAVPFPTFCIRDKNDRLHVHIDDPLEVPADLDGTGEAEAIDELTGLYIRVLERWIRKAPEQYYWVHDIWRLFKGEEPWRHDVASFEGLPSGRRFHPPSA